LAYRVLYRKRAERDLATLAESATLAWFDGLCDAVESLAELPYRCALAPESGLRQKGVRQLLYGEGRSVYRILYRVRDENVEILTIRHGRRRPVKGV
jgi:plasmid stabilization system protein ParE